MMGESCVCLDVDPEGYCLQEKEVIARKEHFCGECREIIKIGNSYEIIKMVYNGDGRISTFKTCMPCMNMRENLFKCGWIFGEIWNDLADHFKETSDYTEEFDEENFEWLIGDVTK